MFDTQINTGPRTRSKTGSIPNPTRKASPVPEEPSAKRHKARDENNNKTLVQDIEVRPISGSLPNPGFTFRILRDDNSHQVVLWGLDCERDKPAMYILDTAANRSVNITSELVYVSPDGTQVNKTIPRYNNSSAALAITDAGRIVFVFGGTCPAGNLGLELPTSNLYWFNVDQREWGEVVAEPGPSPIGRVAPACFAGKDSRLYLFGGEVPANENPTKTRLMGARTYTVGQFAIGKNSDGSTKVSWRWTIIDKEYPPSIPYIGGVASFVALNDGDDYLLLPGVKAKGMPINFKQYRPIKYNLNTDTFTIHHGVSGWNRLSDRVKWYNSMPFPSPLSQSTCLSDPTSLHSGSNPPSFVINAILSPGRSRLWAVSVSESGVKKTREVETAPRLEEIRKASDVSFYALFTTKESMFLMGAGPRLLKKRGKARNWMPKDGHAYIAEIKL